MSSFPASGMWLREGASLRQTADGSPHPPSSPQPNFFLLTDPRPQTDAQPQGPPRGVSWR